jgi:hypothetical protein
MALFGALRTQRLLRYPARPIFAGKRLEWVTPGQRLLYHLHKPRPDGQTSLGLSRWSGWIGSPCSSRPRSATAGGHMASWRLMPHSGGGDRTGLAMEGAPAGRVDAPRATAREATDAKPCPRASYLWAMLRRTDL